MTNRGIFGVSQGQANSNTQSYWIPSLAKCKHSPDGAAQLNTDYLAVDPYGSNNGVWIQFTSGLTYPIVIYGVSVSATSSALTTNTASCAIRIATGPSGSESVRFVGTVTIMGSVQFGTLNDPYGVYVPANTRIAVAYYYSASSGTPTLIQLNYGRANGSYPLATMEAVGSGSAYNGNTFTELSATTPISNGCWVVGHVLQGTSAGIQAIRYALGAAGSEVPVTAYMQPTSGNGTSTGNGTTLWFPPFWWPPSTRLSIQGSASTRGVQGYTFWRSTLQ